MNLVLGLDDKDDEPLVRVLDGRNLVLGHTMEEKGGLGVAD